MSPHQKFKLARQAQQEKVTAEYLAGRLGVSESAVREMELGRNKSLLKKATSLLGPEWGLSQEWFYNASPPFQVLEASQNYNPEVVDLPTFVGQRQGNICAWDLSGQKLRHPIKAWLVNKEVSTYSVLIVDGSQWEPRVPHGATVLVHRTRVVPDRALCLAEINKVPTLAVFSTNGTLECPFQTATTEDIILGVVEMIRRPGSGGPNLEFYDGEPVML